ncbi:MULTISPECIES: DUF5681 domain-containing protein [unclassified Sphingomonas]|uniref:DUF5681 domain-containing protein n=1 Tax=unclassified Sphingomonas TaxID=196159 RepID=UPI0006FF9098|nr:MULTISPECIES: DUF5681 domain-containing protein [unclassified Sphingomonas]KQM57143.1 hypothetical protein ASE65_12440 [Sphingomonas sp. Leaf16]KQN10318.1 hypothetical protein ASE81_12485 [Sphingomonas sp. Leaf29]KQN18119.1 hypothetical protein ASE83_12415 [Sphingomonas sp. Leaf32]
MIADNTPEKQGNLQGAWKPGQSGNPLGRPKGARSKLGEDFVTALRDDFTAHGVAAIQKMREEKPGDYVRVIASLLPKELDVQGHLTLSDALDALPEPPER